MYCHIKKSTINGIHDIVLVTRQLTQILLFGMGRDERRGMIGLGEDVRDEGL